MMTKSLLEQIVAMLLPEMGDAKDRKALVESALHGSSALQKIEWDGAAHTFTIQLVNQLDQYGEISTGNLAPPLVDIPGGTYPMGDDDSDYDDEKPAHTVELAPFQIGRFPVTNAEYKFFIDAGG